MSELRAKNAKLMRFLSTLSTVALLGGFALSSAEAGSSGEGVRKGKAQPASVPPATAPVKHGIHRRVDHTKAYRVRTELGPHLNIKVTPPEKRGKDGRVLVEIYNFSNVYLSMIDFELSLLNAWGDIIQAKVNADDIKQKWSGAVWLTVPGGKLEKITGVRIDNMQLFDDQGKKVKIRYFTDLIKE